MCKRPSESRGDRCEGKDPRPERRSLRGAARRNAAPTFFDAERGSKICVAQGVQACNPSVPILGEELAARGAGDAGR
jgi:hypothetical protein